MDYIKRLLLIFTLVLATLSCNEIQAQEYISVDSCAVITSSRQFEKDFLKSKESELSVYALNNSASSFLKRRNNGSSDISDDNNATTPEIKQFNNLITYIHDELYLEDKNELALLLLLHQIQPNAP